MAFLWVFSFLFLALFSSSISVAIVDVDRTSELGSLLSFKLSLDDPSVLSSWNNSSSSHCDWVGVTCRHRRVRSVSLPSMSLKGKLSPFLFSLRFLSDLDLSENFLSGEIPKEISSLKKLKALDVSNNSLSGEIPPQLGDLTRLTNLYMGLNRFSGKLPPEIGNISSLKNFVAPSCLIKGPLPEELSNLKNLAKLDLSYNPLNSPIPKSIGKLQNLNILNLVSSDLIGFIPAEIGNAAAFTRLVLSDNLLEGEIPKEIGKLTSLSVLNLSSNLLQGKIPKELGDCTSLTTLDLGNNKLSGEIPQILTSLPQLQCLVLSYNNLSGPIPSHPSTYFHQTDTPDLSFLQHHGIFDLSNNRLSGSIPKQLGDCVIIVEILLSNNHLSGQIPSLLSRLTNLTKLDLSGNALTGSIPEELGHSPKLQVLNLANNKLEGSIPESFGLLTSLVKLNLTKNKLGGSVPTSLGNLKELTHMDLSFNELTGELPSELSRMLNLDGLFLQQNSFSGSIESDCKIDETKLLSARGLAGIVLGIMIVVLVSVFSLLKWIMMRKIKKIYMAFSVKFDAVPPSGSTRSTAEIGGEWRSVTAEIGTADESSASPEAGTDHFGAVPLSGSIGATAEMGNTRSVTAEIGTADESSASPEAGTDHFGAVLPSGSRGATAEMGNRRSVTAEIGTADESSASPEAGTDYFGAVPPSGSRGATAEMGNRRSVSAEIVTADESSARPEAGTDPECDVFEAERRVENFVVNQVWSILDSRDGMPRRYVRVKKVFDAEFRLQVTYLVPKDNKGIPVACGRFENGETKDVEDHSIFSSQIIHEFCKRYDKIYPRRGEIWAVFREWNDEWRTSLEKHKLPYKYDLVEILSDYKDVDAWIGVAYMRKLEGFAALFHRKVQRGVCEIQIPSTEMLRFSHKVPAVKVSKKNNESVPDNSYEVDIAAVPEDTSQVDSTDPEAAKVDDKVKRKRRKTKDDSGSNENLQGFRTDQIWATYSLVTDLPTEYVRIKTIIPRPELMFHVIGLEPFTKPSTRHGSCGDFKLKAGRPSILSRTRFSHQVKPVHSNKSRVKVYPRKDEIWALYKNGDSREFDIVVVMEDYSDGML